MDEANLTVEDLTRMMRWGGYPKVANIASLNMTGRKKGALARDTANPTVKDAQPSTRQISLSDMAKSAVMLTGLSKIRSLKHSGLILCYGACEGPVQFILFTKTKLSCGETGG